MEVERRLVEKPFFSICIPQYNRTSFLIEVLKSFTSQTFKSFEVCISDGKSTDGRELELLEFLDRSKLSFIFVRHEINLRYDTNIRFSISLAQGEYCLLNGNDDTLCHSGTLREIYDRISGCSNIGVAITNYKDWTTGDVTRRIFQDQLFVGDPIVAVNHYRNVAFVSGVLIHAKKAQALATSVWDGSEMYQMYLMASILSAGMNLLELELCTVRKDVFIEGEVVDSYSNREFICSWFKPLELPFTRIGRLIYESVKPFVQGSDDEYVLSIFNQLYRFTYPFWIFEYRRVASWKYALSLFVTVDPRYLLSDICIKRVTYIRLKLLYFCVCGAALIIPTTIFFKLKPMLHSIAKRKKS